MAVSTTSLIPGLLDLVEKIRLSPDFDDLKAAYLFGSSVNLRGRDECSDVDLALFAPSFDVVPVETYLKLDEIARSAPLDERLNATIQFHLYSDEQLVVPNRFVKHEILSEGLMLSRSGEIDQESILQLLFSRMLCSKCGQIVDADPPHDCGRTVSDGGWHRYNSSSQQFLFIMDSRFFQVARDVNYVFALLRRQVSLGHKHHLELGIYMWKLFHEYLIANVKQRLLGNYYLPFPEIDQHFLRLAEDSFWNMVCGKKFGELVMEADRIAGNKEWLIRFKTANEIRNAYIHSREPFVEEKYLDEDECRNFVEKVVRDYDFLVKPSVEFAVSLYKAAYRDLRDLSDYLILKAPADSKKRMHSWKTVGFPRKGLISKSREWNELEEISRHFGSETYWRGLFELLPRLCKIEPPGIAVENVLRDFSVDLKDWGAPGAP